MLDQSNYIDSARLESDLLFETLAFLMVSNQDPSFIEDFSDLIEMSDISIDGGFNRYFKKDVSEFRIDPVKPQIHFNLSRNSLFDRLPEYLFYGRQPKRIDLEKGLKKDNKTEQRARNFFNPLEQELHKVRVLMKMIDYGLLDDDHTHALIERLVAFWGIDVKHAQFNREQVSTILRFLPSIQTFVKNQKLAEQFMAEVLQVDQVRFRPHIETIESESNFELSETCLGVDTVLGGDIAFQGIQVEIPCIPGEEHKFIPDGIFERQTRALSRFVFPVGFGLNITPVLKGERSFELQDHQTGSHLNINSYI